MNCARCHDPSTTQFPKGLLFPVCLFQRNRRKGLGPNNGNSPPFVPVPKSWPDLKPGENKFVVPEKMKIKVVQTSVLASARWGKHRHGDARASQASADLPSERGQYERPDKSQELQPDAPEVIGGWKKVAENRIGLANWLTDPAHPLTARVTVNRLWQDCSAWAWSRRRKTSGSGGAPSHPELLDWLAKEFIGGGWDLKATYKMLVTSAAYRQSSVSRSDSTPTTGFCPEDRGVVFRPMRSGFRLGFRRFAGP